MEPAWNFRFEIPDGWAVVDFDPQTRRRSTERQVDASIARAPQYEWAREELTDLIMTLGEEADEQRALAAGALWAPSTTGPVTASLMLLFGQRHEPNSADAEIHALLARLEQPDEYDFGPRSVEVVDLPAGRAVRLRVLTEPGGPAGEPVVVVDTVQHWVPVPGHPEMVVVVSSTPALAYSDEIAAQVDAAAGTLRFEPWSAT